MRRLVSFLTLGPGPSISKTLRFNWRYFGWEGVRHRPVRVARNVNLDRLQGRVEVADVRATGSVQLGFGHVDLFDRRRARAQWANQGLVTFRGRAKIHHGFRLSVQANGHLDIGDDLLTGGAATFVCCRSVTIGPQAMVSWDATIMDTDLHRILEHDGGPVLNEDAPVVLAEHVWVATGAFVGKGTQLAAHSVVGAHAVVNGTHPDEGSVLVGNPARVIRTGIRWQR